VDTLFKEPGPEENYIPPRGGEKRGINLKPDLTGREREEGREEKELYRLTRMFKSINNSAGPIRAGGKERGNWVDGKRILMNSS